VGWESVVVVEMHEIVSRISLSPVDRRGKREGKKASIYV
jgi:hypothetical protein